jgi:hypothetical protein
MGRGGWAAEEGAVRAGFLEEVGEELDFLFIIMD